MTSPRINDNARNDSDGERPDRELVKQSLADVLGKSGGLPGECGKWSGRGIAGGVAVVFGFIGGLGDEAVDLQQPASADDAQDGKGAQGKPEADALAGSFMERLVSRLAPENEHPASGHVKARESRYGGGDDEE